jgi:glycosyltransferase involved in cell wall biosynthesis
MRVLYLSSYIDTPTRLVIEHVASRRGMSACVLSDCEASRARVAEHVPRQTFRSRGKLDLVAARELRGIIVDGRYDVVHAMSSRFLASTLLATRGMADGPQVCGFMGHVGKFSRWNAIHRLTFLHRRLAGVWCNCHAVAEPLVRGGVPRENLFPIHSGYPCREAMTTPDIEVRRELGIPAEAMVVGFAGNMRPVKGVDVLLKAARRLAGEPSIHWLLLGRVEDAEVARLLAHADLQARVHAPGWREDADRLLGAMDVFAMPSRSEGLSRAITEAMERGVCPVVTRVGGTPELVRDGTDGLVISPEDDAALASAIVLLARQPALRQALATSARERIRRDFTVERMVAQMMEMYRTLLERAEKASADDGPVILRFPERVQAPQKRHRAA